MGAVRVQAEDFDAAAEGRALTAGRRDVGALACFVGLCRDEGGRLAALEIEHYQGMAEAEIARVVAEAEARWPLFGVTVVHRFGKLRPGDQIVYVGVAAAHRGEAFAAAEMLMDFLKTRAPFWKRATRVDGAVEGWVEAKADDDAQAARWEKH
jgi:molybdopterin synthase catalytic subunit